MPGLQGSVTGLKARGNFEVDIEWEARRMKGSRDQVFLRSASDIGLPR